ncbi:MAG: tRNA uridine-5-carboxymethylaminomethyl(34) synthesis GTPase MnmE [Clostridia bacterium]|nr:tRNA uridine-5-carboxymethylaminomethyl(34) synthesis GTPase MnmE [Clostridia bacterium]
MRQDEAIYAVATPVGGAIALIRISGRDSIKLISAVFSGKLKHRYMSYGALKCGDRVIDMCMCCAFKAPNSYTGEDMAELYVHGGAAVINSACKLLCDMNIRPAEPGEFTRRAFINGKVDLSQAEAVMDLISAKSERSANAALAQLSGRLRSNIEKLELELIDALSGINAALDYPDELEEDVFSMLLDTLHSVHERLTSLSKQGLMQRVLREGASVVIMGLPNAGKSALMNAILNEERAIVTSIPGTTRDVIEEQLIIRGIPIRLTDTAGIRDTDDVVEKIGIDRANRCIKAADLVLIAVDSSCDMPDELKEMIRGCDPKKSMIVLCKSDIEQKVAKESIAALTNSEILVSSALLGEGIELIKERIALRLCGMDESAYITNMRHVNALLDAKEHIEAAMAESEADCIATDIAMALSCLSRITGREADEEVIDRIFERFCVGK